MYQDAVAAYKKAVATDDPKEDELLKRRTAMQQQKETSEVELKETVYDCAKKWQVRPVLFSAAEYY